MQKILVVDDNHDILRLLTAFLSGKGYNVLKADNGKDALNIAKKEAPDLIVLDILMPGLDGAKVAGILKDDPATKGIPVIFLTCLIEKFEEKEANVRSGEYFVAKPYNGDQLLGLIKEII